MKKSKVSTVSATSVGGVPVVVPNKVVFETSEQVEYNGKAYDGFYVSHNSHDTDVYGGETTAIVLGQMQMFFILNGDHTEELKEAATMGGLLECMEYFHEHKYDANERSDMLEMD